MQKLPLKSAAIFLLFTALAEAQTRIYTVPDGLAYDVDGQRYTSGATMFWPVGSKHVLSAMPSQVGGLNVKSRYDFQGWKFTGGDLPGGATVTVTADPSLKEFYAVYQVEHALDVLFNTCTGTPECPIPGTIFINGAPYQQDAEVFVSAGAVVRLLAVPAPGFIFAGWGQGDNQSAQGFLNTVTVNSPSTVRAIFQPARRVTFATIPAGLDVYADQARIPTPTTLDWGFSTQHAVGAPSPQMDHNGAWWAFSQWSDGGALNHTYTTQSGGPTENLTATFVPVTVTDLKTNPQGLPLIVDGRSNWPNYFFPWAAGEVHRIEAPAQQTDAQGRAWNFVSWSNGAARAQDYTVPPSDAPGGTVRVTANYEPAGHLVVSSAVSGLTIKVDGADCATPCDVRKPIGTVVKLSAPVSFANGDNSRSDFDGWPGSGSLAADWTVTLGADPVTPNLTYHTMNRLTAASTPPDGASWKLDPSSPDGYFDANATVKITVAAQPGFRFRRWSGDASGSTPVANVSMNAPRAVQAILDRVPYIAPAGVQNAVGVTPLAAVAPGSIVSVFGASLAADTAIGPDSPLAQALGCVTVRIGDRILPLFFVSSSQINLQMPDDMPLGDQKLTVSCDGQPDVQAAVTLARNAPGLFQDGDGFGVVIHEDGSVVTAGSPAARGELLTMYGTGFGPTDPPRLLGFPLPADPAYTLADAATVQAGDAAVAPEAAFAAPGKTGIDAVRFRLPDATPAGNLKVRLTINGVDSNTVNLAVAPLP